MASTAAERRERIHASGRKSRPSEGAPSASTRDASTSPSKAGERGAAQAQQIGGPQAAQGVSTQKHVMVPNAAVGGIIGRGGATRFFRIATCRTRTVRLWIAHDTQYWILMYSLGSMYVWYIDASRMSRCDDASTMLRTVKRLMALSFGTERPQFEQRSMAVMPRPCFERPLLRRLDGILLLLFVA